MSFHENKVIPVSSDVNLNVMKAEKVNTELIDDEKRSNSERPRTNRRKLVSKKVTDTMSNRLVNKIVLFFAFFPLLWLLVYLIVGESALPGKGIYFSLLVFVFASHAVGFVFEKIKMPALLGMLLVGIAFRNIPVVDVVGKAIDSKTSSILRNISFCVILARAGLSLNLVSLKKLKWKILKLSIIPVLIEALGFGLVSHFILNMPFLWTILMGFVVSGVSPAVVVPMMIGIQETGLGTAKSIPGLIIAASCIDNIVAITGHSLIIGIVFNSGKLWWILLQCPIQILIGILSGILVAILLTFIRIDHLIKMTTLRFLFLLVISLIALLGFKHISYTTSGPLAVLALTITVKIIWQKVDLAKLKHLTEPINNFIEKNQKAVADNFSLIWSIVFLPFLFTLIGNEVDFAKIKPNMIGLGSACILIALLFRFVATFASTIFSDFNHKEKLFICFAWIPKATVQAALGSIALDMARAAKNQTEIEYATNVLNIAVMSIILTAPLGTILIALFAPRLLNNDTQLPDESYCTKV